LYKDATLTIIEPLQKLALFDGAFILIIPPFPKTTWNSKGVAGYGDLSYQITRRLEIGAGFRYLHDARTAEEPDVSGSLRSATFNVPTYRYFASYAIADGTKVYANVGTGVRSGGFNISASVQLGAPSTYDPEHDKSYELGIKSTFLERRVSFDAAVYYSSYRDLQDTVVGRNAQGVIVQFTGNQQNAFARGVEWNVDWRVATNLSLHLAGDVMTTKITEASPAASYRVGDPINFVPKYGVAIGADYRFNWTATWPGVVHIDFNRKGRSYDTLNGLQKNFGTPDQVSAPPLNFLNLTAEAMRGGWTLGVFARNITDERSYIRAGSSGWQSQARPRNVGISIAKDF
jgi:outer membrane receptor protein involved in Fe transport